MTVGRIREITFDDGAVVSGDVTTSADTSYVDGKFDPKITAFEEGIWLDITSGLPTLSPWRAGVIAWDDVNKCMAVSTSYDGGWIQVGEETQDDGYNGTGGSLANGTVVYLDSSSGNRPKLYKAIASDLDTAQRPIGLVTASAGIADTQLGPYTTSGVVRKLNTNSLTEGTILWLSTTSGEYTSTKPGNQYRQVMIGIVVKQHATEGEIYVNVRDLTDPLALAGYYITDPHGFTLSDNTYMTRSWVEATRVFTLTQVGASTPYYAKGKLKFLTGNKSITLSSAVGIHFIGLNVSTEVLEDLGSSFPLTQFVTTHIPVEYGYVDASGKIILNGNERHTTKFPKFDWLYKHKYLSTQYSSGLQPAATSIDGNGSLATHAQFSITAGVIEDEDISHTVAQKLAADYVNVYYYTGTSWEKTINTLGAGAIMNFPATRLQYNNPATGLVECTNNYHVMAHILATPYGIVVICGQAQYQLVADARLAAKTELNTIITTGLPILEYRAVATFIYKTSNSYSNAMKAILVSVDTGIPFYDWRKSSLNPVAGNSVTNHNNLTGLQGGQAGEYYHVNLADYTNITTKIFPGGAASDTGSKFVFPTKSSLSGLTASAGNSVFETTAKKLYVGDGSTFKVVGGGLIPVSLSLTDFTGSPKKYQAESGKLYLVDMASAAEQYTITAPDGAAEVNFAIQTKNNENTTYLLAVEGFGGTDKFWYNDVEQASLPFAYSEMRVDFAWDSNDNHFLCAVSQTPVSGTFAGDLALTGALTVQGGIVGKTDGFAVGAGKIGQLVSSIGVSADSNNVTPSNLTSIVIPKGVWSVTGTVSMNAGGGSYCTIGISTTSASQAGTVFGYSYMAFAANSTSGIAGGSLTIYLNLSADTTYYLVSSTNLTASSGSKASLFAVRIMA